MAVSTLSSVSNLPDIPDSLHQPGLGFKFPKRSFGKATVVFRSFQSTWFRQWPFLHYDETNDLAYCHTCVKGFKEKKMNATADPAFVSGVLNASQLFCSNASSSAFSFKF